MLKIKNISYILLTLLLLASCDAEAITGEKETLTEDTNTYLEITNNSSSSFWAVYCTDTTDSTWGENLLGEDIIAPGDVRSFVIIPGIKDIRVDTQATYGAGNGAWEAYGLEINDQETYSKALYDN